MTTQSVKPRQSPTHALPEPYGPIVLRLGAVVEVTDDVLAKLSSLNDNLRIELNADGDLEILPPTYSITGMQNADISVDLMLWTRGNGTGLAFDSSAGFRLPNGAVRSPDASWILKSRVAELTAEQRQRFWPISPDFVIELRSSSDTLRGLRQKMEEYMESGVRLGWLIDSLDPDRRVYIYRPGADVEMLEGPKSVSGEPELPGFVLDLKPVWEPAF